jgi:hypothetical protein
MSHASVLKVDATFARPVRYFGDAAASAYSEEFVCQKDIA